MTTLAPQMIPVLLAMFLFCLGALMVFIRRNTLAILLGIELMLNAANLSLVSFSNAMGLIDGQLQVFFIITIAAAESAVGLSILVNLYRNFGTISTDAPKVLNG